MDLTETGIIGSAPNNRSRSRDFLLLLGTRETVDELIQALRISKMSKINIQITTIVTLVVTACSRQQHFELADLK